MRDMVVLLGAEVPTGRAVARKLRTERYCCKLMTSGASAQSVRALDAAGIVLVGEQSEGAAPPDPAILELGLPVLALGSAARALLDHVGARQDDKTLVDTVIPVYYRESPIFGGVDSGERWINRAENYAVEAPFRVIADAEGMGIAFADDTRDLYFLQFQIERNDPDGMRMLRTFAENICGCTPWWTIDNIVEDAIQKIEDAVGDGEAICAISGGLDSTVAALLAQRAIGERARCVFVDTGLLREGESETSARYFAEELGLNFQRVDASERILGALAGVRHMEGKWRVIEREITQALRTQVEDDATRPVFIKGTNYVDILSGNQIEEPRHSAIMAVEPLAELFKDEIRDVGQSLQVAPHILNRQPFPGMGLAARIRGEVTARRLQTLRRADAIFVEEIIQSGQEKRMDRYFALLDENDEHCVIILRALHGAEPSMNVARLPYDLLERTTDRIRAELPAVGRVLYDMTPGMAEWPL